ncbi:hypothetical protein HUK80_17410 [Flavobacterium sp. MAH-1]|uniref:Uncharacterized protein n=1 Tax=Flavobacterium agri TaxID=2743471 RepID=A0A7Y9C8R6_9FLAO|nr:hypothetical protein [Flavobacterium agri]NUY82684.1 hypothetical protein [Flavobacterium agri]NYA72707.1 hypothetical protein [Flavobacterium agri]
MGFFGFFGNFLAAKGWEKSCALSIFWNGNCACQQDVSQLSPNSGSLKPLLLWFRNLFLLNFALSSGESALRSPRLQRSRETLLESDLKIELTTMFTREITIVFFLILYQAFAQGKSKIQTLDGEKFSACVNNATFIEKFKFCLKADSIYINTEIYNNSSSAINASEVKIPCRIIKIINNSKVDVKNDARRHRGLCKRSKIVLYNIETKKKDHIFRFIDTCTNYFICIKVNSKNESKIIEEGTITF